MRTIVLGFGLLVTSLLLLVSHPVFASSSSPIDGIEGCNYDTSQSAVLIPHPISTDSEKPVFNCYLSVLIKSNSALIVAIAVILVVFSGVQYIFAFGNSSNQTAAKQRIISIVTGVIFWTLIIFFLRISGII